MSDDLIAQFLLEGREQALAASRGLLSLERDPGASDVIDEVFRALHTLKGGAGFLDLVELGRLLHAAEGRLEAARAGAAQIDSALVSQLLAAVRLAEAWLDALEASRQAPESLAAETAGLAAALADDQAGAAPAAVASPADWLQAVRERGAALGARTALRYAPSADAYFRGDDPLALLGATPGLLWMAIEPGVFGPLETYAPFACGLVFVALSAAPVEAVRETFRLVPDEVALVGLDTAGAPTRLRTLRVAADQVDLVAALVDELVIAKNALSHLIANGQGGPAADGREAIVRQAALDRAVVALHGAVATLRLAPLGPTLDRLSLQARELAVSLGRDVSFEIGGGELAVDKAIVDGLFEPLLHIVRNAVDHGVEPPAERAAAGKPPRAILALHAFARGDEAVIEMRDDGRGVDPDRVRATAVARGLLDAQAAAALSDGAAVDLVFSPGFSTAAALSEVSGRGVGLDAVRAAIARLGGRVELETEHGQGTSVRIVVPLRTVLTKVAVANAGGERFGVPVAAIREVVRLRGDEVTEIRAGRVFVHRDQVLPLLRLSDLLGLTSACPPLETALLVGEGEAQVAVAVDSLAEQIEAPVRPMSGLLSGLPGVKGSLVDGEGRVLMVLDLPELVA